MSEAQPAFDLGADAPAPASRKSKPKTANRNLSKPKDRKVVAGVDTSTKPDMVALAATLPPRQPSSPEEIAARLAARRERIAKDKAEGRRDDRGRPVKFLSADIIVRLVSRLDEDGKARGATMAELTAALGWKAPTVRGYIGGVLRPRGLDIRVEMPKSEARRYVLPPKGRKGRPPKTFALRREADA